MNVLIAVIIPFAVAVAAYVLGGEVRGRIRRRAGEEVKRGVAVLPEPERARREEEWMCHLREFKDEPIHALKLSRRYRLAAREIAGELAATAEGATTEGVTGQKTARPPSERKSWRAATRGVTQLLTRVKSILATRGFLGWIGIRIKNGAAAMGSVAWLLARLVLAGMIVFAGTLLWNEKVNWGVVIHNTEWASLIRPIGLIALAFVLLLLFFWRRSR